MKWLAGDTARATTSIEVKDLRREARDLKAGVAEQALELRLINKKHDRGWGQRRMRYPASEKLRSPKTTFYRWYDRHLVGGPEALEGLRPTPSRVWDRIPTPLRKRIKDLALKESELSPCELAV